MTQGGAFGYQSVEKYVVESYPIPGCHVFQIGSKIWMTTANFSWSRAFVFDFWDSRLLERWRADNYIECPDRQIFVESLVI